MKTQLIYIKILRVSLTEYPNFSDRLKFVMTWRDYSIQKLATRMYLSYSTINGYRCGKRMPDTATLSRIATELQVSTDFLLGLVDYICID